jgi:hypothetical protein
VSSRSRSRRQPQAAHPMGEPPLKRPLIRFRGSPPRVRQGFAKGPPRVCQGFQERICHGFTDGSPWPLLLILSCLHGDDDDDDDGGGHEI